MIVNARKKRDRHLVLMEKANERVRKKTLDANLVGDLVKSIKEEKKGKTSTFKILKKGSDAVESTSPKTTKNKNSFGKFGQVTKSLKEKNSSLTKTSDKRSSSQDSPTDLPHLDVKLGEIKKEQPIDSIVTSNKEGLPPMGSLENKEKLKKRMTPKSKKSNKELGRLRLQFDRLEQSNPTQSPPEIGFGLNSPLEHQLSGLPSKLRDSKETLETETHRSAGIILNGQ